MPQTGEQARIAHLLRRFGLGASEAEVAYYGEGGYARAVDRLLDFESVDEGFNIAIDQIAPKKAGPVKMRTVQTWWLLRMVMTRRPLQEKMTLFWHDHFATSAQKVDGPFVMLHQNELLRANCVGPFQTLLSEVSKDPAMLYWLDNQFNVKGKPNENFAREVMELFTLGIGQYSEKDIQEAARCFTGWTIDRRGRGKNQKVQLRNADFTFNEELHDDGVKSLLGNTGRFNGDDVLGILCGNPQTSRYITRKIWEWFVYPKPDDGLIDGLAADFRKNGLRIKVLLRRIMEHPEFTSERAMRKLYKNPIDFTIATYRQLGLGAALKERFQTGEQDEVRQALLRLAPIAILENSAKAMGMEIMFPPDVSGWDGGASWISSATMVERIKWADRLFGPPVKGTPSLRFPAAFLVPADGAPAGFVDQMLSVFDVSMPDLKRKQLAAAAESAAGGTITSRNANACAVAVGRLIFGSPEFQFC